MMETKEAEKYTSYGTYPLVWSASVLLILGMVGMAKLGGVAFIVTALMATLNAFLVLYYFMNLGRERGFFKLIIVITVAVFASVMGMIFSDIAYRH